MFGESQVIKAMSPASACHLVWTDTLKITYIVVGRSKSFLLNKNVPNSLCETPKIFDSTYIAYVNRAIITKLLTSFLIKLMQ